MDYSEEVEDIKVIKGWQAHVKAGNPYRICKGKFEILYLAQYFLDSFYRQAGDNDVLYSSQNISGAFIRKLIRKLAGAPKNGKDLCSLIFSVFMVLPLLLTGALYKEIKFSRSEKVGANNDSLDSAMNAYAHHVVVNSEHEIVISDIQGIIKPDQTIVFFDP
ncbi:hypothetical protein DFJ58DRAFT_835755 [Suillus subalutaceus]|uniref:uncharacterized protein n=1 Tax=Suillus subalutaceus TaxID=48586 RepID=UPI001B882147|nr:uncharacterized protein DFJ58DRAFT_835755 [Suillus subalutaceus]KAG1878132.1 hypothetical protein DFJ58DRAFT_835755 [Suillus subalutaceus]